MEQGRFLYDARTAVVGGFPMPAVSSEAAELLNSLLNHAVASSPRLHLRDHKLRCRPDETLEQLAHELLRTPFQMPCEGGESPVPTLDRVALLPDEIQYSINETFAAYLLFAVNGQVAFSGPRAIEAKMPLPLFETDRSLVVSALQSLHQQRTVAWNSHAIYALTHSNGIQPREAFGLVELEVVLAKLGASTAP